LGYKVCLKAKPIVAFEPDSVLPENSADLSKKLKNLIHWSQWQKKEDLSLAQNRQLQ